MEILKGCAQAAAEYDLDVMLTGREAEIRRVAEENEISLNRMELVDTPDIITMEDHAGDIMKSKSQSSMAEGLRQLAAGNGDAFISAGNSGALVVGATTIVKEYSRAYTGAEDEIPYYAIANDDTAALYARYAEKAAHFPRLHLLGRLAEYRYYNMDAIVARSLELCDALLKG